MRYNEFVVVNVKFPTKFNLSCLKENANILCINSQSMCRRRKKDDENNECLR